MRNLWIVACCLLSGCLTVPDGIEPVDNFELNRYLGKWYEIARLDHSFERGLEAVSAEYSLRDDGGIRVIPLNYGAGIGGAATIEVFVFGWW